MKLYHNPRCSKSRLAVQYLEEKGQEFETVLYLKEAPSKKDIETIVNGLQNPLKEIIRKDNDVYKSQLKGKDLNKKEVIDVLVKHPEIMERPVLVTGGKAMIGRPTEMLDELL